MKEEALKLADELDGLNSCEPVIIKACEDMIRRLVEELDKKTKPLSDEEICQLWKASQEDGVGMSLGYTTQEHYFARLIEERHGIK